MNKGQNLKWKTVKKGSSFHNYQLLLVQQILQRQVRKFKIQDLEGIARKLSKILSQQTGLSYWNVILVKGQYGRKSICNGNYYVLYERQDGMQAFIWLNKLQKQNINQKSILQKSIYF